MTWLRGLFGRLCNVVQVGFVNALSWSRSREDVSWDRQDTLLAALVGSGLLWGLGDVDVARRFRSDLAVRDRGGKGTAGYGVGRT